MSLSLILAQKARLLATLAGLAWLLGLTPTMPVRLLTVVLVVAGTMLDTLTDPGTPPAAIRITTARGPRP